MSVHPSKVSAMHFAQCDHCDWMAAAYTHHDAQAKDQAHAEACLRSKPMQSKPKKREAS